tara:strand:+ start:433 stop:828 length:396 start_codon:yes stop_codon:yes gene_type:complete
MDITIAFGDHDINESLQVGDDVYYCPPQNTLLTGGFDTVDNENFPATGIVHMGKCTGVDRVNNKMVIKINLTNQAAIANGLGLGDFIMFSKSTQANLTSLLGYYAETTFINDSPYEAELFATSTEFSESSK